MVKKSFFFKNKVGFFRVFPKTRVFQKNRVLKKKPGFSRVFRFRVQTLILCNIHIPTRQKYLGNITVILSWYPSNYEKFNFDIKNYIFEKYLWCSSFGLINRFEFGFIYIIKFCILQRVKNKEWEWQCIFNTRYVTGARSTRAQLSIGAKYEIRAPQ